MAMTGLKKTDPRYGRGVHDIQLDDLAGLSPDIIYLRLKDLFESPKYRPPVLPGVALELLAATQNPDVTFNKILRLLDQDQILAGRLLQVANSPGYLCARPARSIKQSLQRLGLQTVRDLTMEVALNMRVFRSKAYGPAMERLRRHSQMVAYIARSICRMTSFEAEYAYMCGLFHDVGIAGALLVLGDAGPKGKEMELDSLWPAIDQVHVEAAEILTTLWKLNPDLTMAVRHHHQPSIDGAVYPLAAVICLAEDMANELGATVVDRKALYHTTDPQAVDTTKTAPLNAARESLGISDAGLAKIAQEAEELLASIE